MKKTDTEKLLKLLVRYGVEHFKSGALEVRFAPGAAAAAPSYPHPVDNVRTPAPATAASVPPVEVSIPHHVNEVQNLLKMTDEQLVDRLFPDYTAQPKPPAPTEAS